MRRTKKSKSVDGGAVVMNGGGGYYYSPQQQQFTNHAHRQVSTPTPPNSVKKSHSPHHHNYNSGHQYIINNNNRKSPSLPVVIPSPGKGFYAGAKFESEPRPCAIPSPPVHWTAKACSAEVEDPSDSFKLEPKLGNLQVYTYSLKTYLNIM